MAYARDFKLSGELDPALARARDPARIVGWIAIAVIAGFLIFGFCA